MATKMFFKEFDFAAFFDQINLEENVRSYFVIRVGNETYDLTRVPMGSSFSAHTAQVVTWSLLEALLTEEQYSDVEISTMLDNVAFASNNKETLNSAIDKFLTRCQEAGVTLNDNPIVGDKHAEMAAKNATQADNTTTFLGEEFYMNPQDTKRGYVRNRQKNVAKLREAYTRLQAGITPEHENTTTNEVGSPTRPQITTRQFISCISLVLWMAHTISKPLYTMHDILALYSKLIRIGGNDYDKPIQITGQDVATIGRCIGTLLQNEWAKIPTYEPTSFVNLANSSGGGCLRCPARCAAYPEYIPAGIGCCWLPPVMSLLAFIVCNFSCLVWAACWASSKCVPRPRYSMSVCRFLWPDSNISSRSVALACDTSMSAPLRTDLSVSPVCLCTCWDRRFWSSWVHRWLFASDVETNTSYIHGMQKFKQTIAAVITHPDEQKSRKATQGKEETSNHNEGTHNPYTTPTFQRTYKSLQDPNHKEVHQFAKELHIGDNLYIKWQSGEEQGQWLGGRSGRVVDGVYRML